MIQDILDRQARRVRLARLAQLVALDQGATPDLLEKLDLLVRREAQALRDLLGPQDQPGTREYRDLLERLERQER